MFDAQILINPVTATAFSIYSPWMSRGGDNATFTLDLIQETMTSGNFIITVHTKAAEDAGDGGATPVATKTIANGDGPGRYPFEVNGGMQDLVRFKFTFDASVGTGQYVMFRMLAPSWFDSVDTNA